MARAGWHSRIKALDADECREDRWQARALVAHWSIALLRWWRALVGQWNEMVLIDGVVTIGCVAWAWAD